VLLKSFKRDGLEQLDDDVFDPMLQFSDLVLFYISWLMFNYFAYVAVCLVSVVQFCTIFFNA
jgi:hypothetical protein